MRAPNARGKTTIMPGFSPVPASSSVQYKYYRKNADGSVTWENVPGGGNRTLNVPASGGTALNDTVGW